MGKVFWIYAVDASALVVEKPLDGRENKVSFEQRLNDALLREVEEMGGYMAGGLRLQFLTREEREDEA